MLRIEIGGNESGQRLDRLVSRVLPAASWAQINKLFRKKCFKLNGGRVTKGSVFVNFGDVLEVFLSDENLKQLRGTGNRAPAAAVDVGRLIIYEDENLLAVSKPAGMLTHSADKSDSSDLTSVVKAYLSNYIDRYFEPAAISRLDRGTSGVVLFAKNYSTLKALGEEMRAGRVDRIYECIVEGELEGSGIIAAGYHKDEALNKACLKDVKVFRGDAGEFGADADGMSGSIVRTKFCSLKYSIDKSYTLVRAELITGKSHQIRASLAAIGHPIAGDIKYGSKKMLFGRRAPFLRCSEVRVFGECYKAEDADFSRILSEKFK